MTAMGVTRDCIAVHTSSQFIQRCLPKHHQNVDTRNGTPRSSARKTTNPGIDTEIYEPHKLRRLVQARRGNGWNFPAAGQIEALTRNFAVGVGRFDRARIA
jgi:hypothetical protein